MENNEFLLKNVVAMCWTHQIALRHHHAPEDLQQRLLVLQIWFVRSTMPWRIYSEDYRSSKYGLYGQPCHGGFTA